MLNHISTGTFKNHVEQQGGANSILYYGAKKTKTIEYEMELSDNRSRYDITIINSVLLNYGLPDSLFIGGEKISTYLNGKKHEEYYIEPDTQGSDLIRKTMGQSLMVSELLSNCRVFQFHDTSQEARSRQASNLNDNHHLKSDGGNLAAFLYAIKMKEPDYYDRIVNQIKAVFPLFGDFEMLPLRLNENSIMLNWFEDGSDYLFGPHQLSDGTLRFIALATLLLQPPETRPAVIIIDEPELGLHPAALTSFASIVHTVSPECQVFLATQSPALLNEFLPENILVIERDERNKQSIIKQLDANALKVWKGKYSLAELWDKNILGGRP
jgi:predicted ATPase